VIVNGAAGGGRARQRISEALRELHNAGLETEVHRTAHPAHATELAREAADAGHRKFITMGGDGTSFEVINGLFAAAPPETPFQLGLIPLGTGNSFLRDFEVTDTDEAIRRIVRGKSGPCDVLRVSHRDGILHYMNILSIGFSASAGELTNRRFKPFGAAGYILAVVSSLASLQHPQDPIRVDGTELVDDRAATLLSFSNSKFTGGAMMMAPSADTADGKLDVIRVGKLSRIELLRAFPRIFQGTHTTMPIVEEQQVKRVDFLEEREQPVMIDGEIMHLALRSIEVMPGALELYR